MKSVFIVKRWLFLLVLLALLLPVVAQDTEPLPLPPASDESGIALPALEEEPTPAPQPALPQLDGGVRAPSGLVIEMLQNGGYEIGDPATSYKLPLHWTGVNLLTPDRLRCNTPTLTFSQSGECAFRFNVTNSNVNRRIASVATFYGPSTGGRIDISVAVKGTDITGGVVSVKFGFLDGDIQKDKIQLPRGTYDYQTLSKTYWMPKTLAWIRVAVGPNGYGALLVDNASLLFTPPGPVVVNDTYTILRNESLTTTLTNGLFANDSLNGATLQSYTQPASGTVIVNADGTFTYTPSSPTFTGVETFTYTVASTGGSATGTATIFVNPNAPVAVDDTYPDVIINTPFSQPAAGVLANDTVEGATLSLSSTTGSAGGTLNLSTDGSFTYTPPANFPDSGPSGNDTFTYTLSNVTGFESATITFTVNAVPVAMDDTYDVYRDVTGVYASSGSVIANDALNGGAVTTGVIATTLGGSVTLAPDGTFTYALAPTAGLTQMNVDSFTYEISNAYASDTATVTLNVYPTIPVAVDDDYDDVVINTPYSVPASGVLTNDTPHGGVIALLDTTGSQGGTLSLSADGSFTYTPPADFPVGVASDTETFAYTLTNVTGSDGATITFTVNRMPVAVNDTYDVYRDASGLYSSSASVTVNDTLNGATVTAATIPTTLGGSVTIDASGNFTYTLAATAGLTQMDADSFSYTLSSAFGSDTATVTLNVYPMIPVAVDDDYDDVVINTPYSVPASGVLTNDTPHGGVLALISTTGSQGGTLSLSADGSFTYTPPADFPVGVASDTETFAYTLTNVTGSDGATITFTVNRVPVAVDDEYDIYRNGGSMYMSTVSLTANDTLNGGIVSPSMITTTLGQLVIVWPAGNFEYVLPAMAGQTQVDVDSFTYTLVNTYGSDTATVTLNIYPRTPVAADDNYDDVVINTPYSVPASGVLTNDTPRGGVLALLDTTGSQGGTLSLSADGSFTYTPPANFPSSGLSAQETFSYTLTNVTGSDGATITFTVNAIPIAVDDQYDVYRDATGIYSSSASVTVNDTLNGGTVTAATIPTTLGGSVTIDGSGNFTYTLAATAGLTQMNVDSFSYTLSSAFGSDTATVTLNVYPMAPEAVDDDYIAIKGTPLTVNAAAGVLANDMTRGAVISTFDDSGLLGTLSFNTGDGSFTYTPPLTTPTREYVDAFTYTLTNVTGSDTATVEITVRPPAPVAVDDDYNVLHNAVLTVAAPGFLDNDTLNEATVTVGTLTGAGTLSASINGSFTYTPAAAPPYAYSVTFDYTLTHEGGTDTGTVTINVAPAAPTAADDALMTYRDTPLTIDEATDLLANDTLYTATISAPAVATPVATSKGGSVTRNANGTFTYTPPTGFVSADANDLDTFTYTVTNVTGSDTATVEILVLIPPPTAVDDAYDAAPHISLDVPAADGLLANDTLESGTLTTTGTVATTEGGTVIIAADGSFIYHPPVTLANDTDTFTYTLENSTGSDTATVTITLLDKELIWFVDASAPAGGDGTHFKPFNALSSLNAVLTANDLVYIFANASAYDTTTAISLKSGQKVYGQEVDLETVTDWLPDYSIVPTTGARPTLTSTGTGIHLFSLNTNNTFAGFNVGATGGYAFYGPAAVTAGTVKISSVSKAVVGGGAIALLNGGAMEISFGEVRGTTANNLPAFHFKSTTGNFTVTTGITTAGGGAFGALTPAFHVENSTATYALTGVNITNSGGAGFRFASSGARGTLNVTGGSNTVSATFGFALDLAFTTLNASFQRLFVDDPAQGAVNLFWPQGTLTVNEFDVITPNNAMLEMFEPQGTYTFGSSTTTSNFTPKPIVYGANAGLVIVKGGSATLNLNNLQIEQARFTSGVTGTTTTNIVYLEGAGGNVTVDGVTSAFKVNGAAIKINNGSQQSNTVTLSNGTFDGLYNLLWAENAGNVVISDTTVASTDDDAIYFHNGRDLTLTNVTINSIGDASGDYALDLKDTRIGGAPRVITITNSNFRNMAHHGLFAEMSTAQYLINVTGGEFANMTTKTACAGVSCAGTAILASSLVTAASYSPDIELAFTGTNFSQYGSRAIHVEAVNAAGGSPDVKLTVTGGTFTGSTGAVNSGYGISVNTAGANTEAVFNVTGAVFTNYGISALAVNADGNGADVSGKFNNNTVTGSAGLFGVVVFNNPVVPTDNSTVRVQIMNNTFNNAGINVQMFGSTGSLSVMDVATIGNTFNNAPRGIRYANQQTSGTVCAVISGNNVSGVTDLSGIIVQNQLSGTFNIEGLTGPADSYLSGINTMGGKPVSALGTFGAANCLSDTM